MPNAIDHADRHPRRRVPFLDTEMSYVDTGSLEPRGGDSRLARAWSAEAGPGQGSRTLARGFPRSRV